MSSLTSTYLLSESKKWHFFILDFVRFEIYERSIIIKYNGNLIVMVFKIIIIIIIVNNYNPYCTIIFI
jgi:hypothetical protein